MNGYNWNDLPEGQKRGRFIRKIITPLDCITLLVKKDGYRTVLVKLT